VNIASGDIARKDETAEESNIRKASPSISAEWAGY
jgi:bis(5'-nucleosyl)-tetraphosphatase (symmetrical)